VRRIRLELITCLFRAHGWICEWPETFEQSGLTITLESDATMVSLLVSILLRTLHARCTSPLTDVPRTHCYGRPVGLNYCTPHGLIAILAFGLPL